MLEPFHITFFFLGLFYHLKDPIFILRQAFRLARETLIIDTEIVPREKSALFLAHRDPGEPTTFRSNLTSTIRVVPTRRAPLDLLQDNRFEVEFLEPQRRLPPEYLSG